MTSVFGKCRMKVTYLFGKCRNRYSDTKEKCEKEDFAHETTSGLRAGADDDYLGAGRPVTRLEIEHQMPVDRQLSATTVLSFLSRLQDKGFVDVYRDGKSNVYEAAVPKEAYLQEESRSIWKRLYQNSVGNFMAALGGGAELSDEDLDELQDFLDRERRERGK